jgi:hypothetical protein
MRYDEFHEQRQKCQDAELMDFIDETCKRWTLKNCGKQKASPQVPRFQQLHENKSFNR